MIIYIVLNQLIRAIQHVRASEALLYCVTPGKIQKIQPADLRNSNRTRQSNHYGQHNGQSRHAAHGRLAIMPQAAKQRILPLGKAFGHSRAFGFQPALQNLVIVHRLLPPFQALS